MAANERQTAAPAKQAEAAGLPQPRGRALPSDAGSVVRTASSAAHRMAEGSWQVAPQQHGRVGAVDPLGRQGPCVLNPGDRHVLSTTPGRERDPVLFLRLHRHRQGGGRRRRGGRRGLVHRRGRPGPACRSPTSSTPTSMPTTTRAAASWRAVPAPRTACTKATAPRVVRLHAARATASGSTSATCWSTCCTRPATRPTASACWCATCAAATSPGSWSPATRCSSAPSAGPTSRAASGRWPAQLYDSLHAKLLTLPDRDRDLSRPPGGQRLRRGPVGQAVVHDRLREALEPAAGDGQAQLRRRADADIPPPPAGHGRHPARQPRPGRLTRCRTPSIRLGLRENLGQFSLLVLVNAFVGAMVGLERSILPAIAEQEFQLAARAAILSFIVVFGVTKALTNYVAGRLSDRFGRKHVLVAGWLVAMPVPFLLMWAPELELGPRRQRAARREPGADLVDDGDHEDRPGRAEAARPGDGAQRVLGLRRRGRQRARHRLDRRALRAAARSRSIWASSMSQPACCCRRSRSARPGTTSPTRCGPTTPATPGERDSTQREIFRRTSLTDRNLSSVSQAGLVNNLNDGMAWGLFPLVFAAAGHEPGTDRHARGDLSGRVGHRADLHRRAVRPRRPQVADRLGHVGAGGGHRRHGAGGRLRRLRPRRGAARPRHRDGLSRPCWPPSATSPTRPGARRPSASTGCGATSAMPSARCWPASPPTCSGWLLPYGWSPG